MPSHAEARRHFDLQVRPRRVRDPNAENIFYKKHGRIKRIYRRVGPTEEFRGEPYPCLTSGITQLAHFGQGVGVYYMQLIIQAIIFVIGGLILIPLFLTYASVEYGSNDQDPRLYASGACIANAVVNATSGCDDGAATCSVIYRESCILTKNGIVADIGMVVVVLLLIFIAKVPEHELLEVMDEAVQSLQDYSVMVMNPPPDASNPDEWYEFFGRFGSVRLVTIVKSNAELCELLIKKHFELKYLAAQQSDGEYTSPLLRKFRMSPTIDERQKRLRLLQDDIDKICAETPSVKRVFVTFDMEESQRHCLQELEVPDIEFFKSKRVIVDSKRDFRGQFALDIAESPEMDNIYWLNIEVGGSRRRTLQLTSLVISIGMLVVCFFFIAWIDSNYVDNLPIAIALSDMALPVIFEAITDIERAHDEDDRQDSLLVKLFGARLLNSILFPYIFTTWSEFLNNSNLLNIVNTQLAACFIAPITDAFDPVGVMYRNILSNLLSANQLEMNHYWRGSEWTLADRYTNLAKVVFLALFYSFLSPLGIFIGAVAFTLIFLVDRYRLLRVWKQPKMIDATMASRIRHIIVLAVAAHMYATCRFIYSWPMDEAYAQTVNGVREFSKVDKTPPYNILYIEQQPWHTSGQAATIVVYKWITVIVIAFCAYIILGSQAVGALFKLFFTEQESKGDVVGIPFFSVPKIGCYCPVAERRGETLICADTSDAIEEFQPSVFSGIQLSMLLPENIRKQVLSTVKWYGLGGLGKTKHRSNLFVTAGGVASEGAPRSAAAELYIPSADNNDDDENNDSPEKLKYVNDTPDYHAFDSRRDLLSDHFDTGSDKTKQKPGASGISSPDVHAYNSLIDLNKAPEAKHHKRNSRRKVKKGVHAHITELPPVVTSASHPGSAVEILQHKQEPPISGGGVT